MSYKAIDVANHLLNIFRDDEDGITNLKMNKLLYYAQGFSFQRLGRELFSEDIEAWGLGPVVPSVYHAFQEYGKSRIPIDDSCDLVELDINDCELLVDVLREYGIYTGGRLKDMTHKEGGPWKKNYIAKEHIVIPKTDIKSYFQNQEPQLEKFDILEHLDSPVVDLDNAKLNSKDWVW